jgi:hypothetical protein
VVGVVYLGGVVCVGVCGLWVCVGGEWEGCGCVWVLEGGGVCVGVHGCRGVCGCVGVCMDGCRCGLWVVLGKH